MIMATPASSVDNVRSLCQSTMGLVMLNSTVQHRRDTAPAWRSRGRAFGNNYNDHVTVVIKIIELNYGKRAVAKDNFTSLLRSVSCDSLQS